MKRFILLLVITLAMMANVNLKAQFVDANSNSWWDIRNYNDLVLLSSLPAFWGSQFELTNHILVPSGQNFLPIGSLSTPFTGKFRGKPPLQNYKFIIYNLVINRPYESCIGLFGVNEGEISDLLLSSCDITGNNTVGAYCGINRGSISNCEFYFDDLFNKSIINGDTCVGGYIGWNQSGYVSNCKPTNFQRLPGYIYVQVSGDFQVGGFVGSHCEAVSNQITNCEVYNTEIYPWSNNSQVGGFAGFNSSNISDCYVRGYTYIDNSSNNSKTGGFVGDNYGGAINNCHVSDSVIVNSEDANYVGGFAGFNKAEIENSSSGASVAGNGYVGGFVGLDSGYVSNCESYSDILASDDYVGGFVGFSKMPIEYCFVGESQISALPADYVGGFSGKNISNIEYSGAKSDIVYGHFSCGGFVGGNYGNIHDSYARGSVTTMNGDSVGGFVGVIAPNAYVIRCFSTGTAIGSNPGGFVQYNNYGWCLQSFWDEDASGIYWSYSGSGCSTAAMKTELLYTNWDFTNIWQIASDNDGYPSFTTIANYKINFANKSRKIEIYPNPVRDMATININEPVQGFTNVSVYSINGEKLETLFVGNLNRNEHTLKFDGSKYTTGMYYLVLETNNTKKMEPIVIKH